MYQLISIPYDNYMIDRYGGAQALNAMVRETGCDGIEWVWGGEPVTKEVPEDVINGYHLTFFNDWLDYYLGNHVALEERFGNRWSEYYRGHGAEDLVERYREDLRRAMALQSQYTVFHASDVSIEETYTYRWNHTDRQVIDAVAEVVNRVYGREDLGVTLLLENLWWPGFRFTDPEMTAELLDQIQYPNKGIMLDTGHLMNTNWNLRTEEEAVDYVLDRYRAHGTVGKCVKGLHLHQSLSGQFAAEHSGMLPRDLPRDYIEKFCFSYDYIQKIDTHRPFISPAVQRLVKEIQPQWLVHELAAADRAAMVSVVETQRRALGAKDKGTSRHCRMRIRRK